MVKIIYLELPIILNINDDCTSLPENYQLQEDYYSLFNNYNEDKLSDLIDNDSLIEETSLPDFEPEEITFDLES
ncbi:8958_t:CDS:1, partial [Gigaspora margarita]